MSSPSTTAAAVPSSSSTPPRVSTATPDDLPALTSLINAAYEVETGDSGVAFKKTLRLVDPEEELLPAVREGRCMKATLDGEEGEATGIVGCLVWERVGGSSSSGGARGGGEGTPTRFHFGPFAVSPALQKRGVGKTLLDALYAKARGEGAASIDIEVVHWRTDILPLYMALGYETIGEAPFVAPERTTRPCHFVLMRKALV